MHDLNSSGSDARGTDAAGVHWIRIVSRQIRHFTVSTSVTWASTCAGMHVSFVTSKRWCQQQQLCSNSIILFRARGVRSIFLSSQTSHFIIMSDLESTVRPPFFGSSSSSPVVTLDPFDHHRGYDNGEDPIDSLSVVSIDGPPSMTDDATAAAILERHVGAAAHGGDEDDEDDDVDGAILSWMASTDFGGDGAESHNAFAAIGGGGGDDDQRANIEAPQENDVRFGRGRTYSIILIV
jgi:hypothetical protein